jgi:uncharacterized protein YkwD
MKIKLAGVFLVALASLVTINSVRSQTSKSQTKPSNDSLSESEYELLNEINQVRANPQVYADYLEKLKPLFNGKQYSAAGRIPLMTEEGWFAVDEAIKFLRATKPAGPLNPSRGLGLAALAHVKDQSGNGMTGHRGANSSMIEDRVKPFGNWQGDIGENIAYGNDSARERILTWLIDDGVPSRGHRLRLMSSNYKVAGVSCGGHPEYGGMCVLTLAGGFVDVPASVTTGTGNGATGNGSSVGTGNGAPGNGSPTGVGTANGAPGNGSGSKPKPRTYPRARKG